jgi:phage baseplate assembly protein W
MAVSPQIKQVIFSDLPLNLTKHPVTNKLVTVKNDASISQALKNLVLTNFYERRYDPLFGCGVRELLFENMTPGVARDIEKRIELAIQNYEPRIQILDINVTPQYDDNRFDCTIVYRSINQQIPSQVTISLERVR